MELSRCMEYTLSRAAVVEAPRGDVGAWARVCDNSGLAGHSERARVWSRAAQTMTLEHGIRVEPAQLWTHVWTSEKKMGPFLCHFDDRKSDDY